MRLTALGLTCLISCALAAPAAAGWETDPLINVNLAFTPPSYAGCGEFSDDLVSSCENLESTHDPSNPAFAWMVVSRDGGLDGLLSLSGDAGIGAVQWGIAYEADVAVVGWALCTGGAEIPQNDVGGTYPESGTGNAATWEFGCYLPAGEVAKVGYLTLDAGSAGLIQLISDPRLSGQPCTGEGAVSACADGSDTIGLCVCLANMGFGMAGAGSVPFCGNACDATPIENTSWGELKNLF